MRLALIPRPSSQLGCCPERYPALQSKYQICTCICICHMSGTSTSPPPWKGIEFDARS
jgi:hypothetical protein